MVWYKVIAKMNHQSGGKHIDAGFYFWDASIWCARRKYRGMPDIKEGETADIRELGPREGFLLEQDIVGSGLPLKIAREKWFTYSPYYRYRPEHTS